VDEKALNENVVVPEKGAFNGATKKKLISPILMRNWAFYITHSAKYSP
jgi:hypothetical protein